MFGFEYVEGLKPPTSPKQQFGTDVHKVLEHWLMTGKIDDSIEAEVAKQGVPWIPPPDTRLLTEHNINFKWNDRASINGYIDCIRPPTMFPYEALVVDHKTTSDLRWAMSASELMDDPQALIYSIWAMLTYEVKEVAARWVYYAATNPDKGPRKPRGSKPIEVKFEANDSIFLDKVARLHQDIERIVFIRSNEIKGSELIPNPSSCGMYGGCFHQERCTLSADDRLDAYFK